MERGKHQPIHLLYLARHMKKKATENLTKNKEQKKIAVIQLIVVLSYVIEMKIEQSQT